MLLLHKNTHACLIAILCDSAKSLDLLQVSLAAKMGEGIKARETCNTWQLGSLAGQDPVQSASFYKKPISNHMLRKDNDRTERGSAMFFDNGRLKL